MKAASSAPGSAKADEKAAPADRRPRSSVQGKRLLVGILVALVVAVGLVFYFGVTGGSTHVPLSKPGVGFTTDPAAADAGELSRDR